MLPAAFGPMTVCAIAGLVSAIIITDARILGLSATSSLLWFGQDVSRATKAQRTAADSLTLLCAVAGVASAAAFLVARSSRSSKAVVDVALDLLFELLIPGLAGAALCVAALLTTRAVGKAMTRSMCSGRTGADFGRKSIIVSVSALLFASSTFYRSLNIASEGAALCRGTPTRWNAPAYGRTVATFGEVALVVQASVFIEAASKRLGTTRGGWSGLFERLSSVHLSTCGPVLLAELFSWSGVLSGNSKFFCAEYVVWMLIASTWVWDSAELLHKAARFSDLLSFSVLLLAGAGLFFFNAVYELPHFFSYDRNDTAAADIPGLWECAQAAESPLWRKRLPFFVCYFIGASWISAAGAFNFLRTQNLGQWVRSGDADSSER